MFQRSVSIEDVQDVLENGVMIESYPDDTPYPSRLLLGWRAWDLAHTLPAYDDVLEVLWTIRWYDGALRGQHGFLLYPLAFYPTGWHVATFAGGPFLFVVLLPLYWLGGAAFAYNVVTLLTFLVSFAGMLKLARLFVPTLAATLAALLFMLTVTWWREGK